MRCLYSIFPLSSFIIYNNDQYFAVKFNKIVVYMYKILVHAYVFFDIDTFSVYHALICTKNVLTCNRMNEHPMHKVCIMVTCGHLILPEYCKTCALLMKEI